MHMTSDIYFKNVIDLVLFTVVPVEKVRNSVWDPELISPHDAINPNLSRNGLALFVVTVPAMQNGVVDPNGKRMLPGGTIGANESLDAAAARLANETVGVPGHTRLRQVGIFDEPNRNPGERVLSFAYWGVVDFDYLRKYLGGRERVGLELVNSSSLMEELQRVGGLELYDGVSRFGGRRAIGPQTGRTHDRLPFPLKKPGNILDLDHDDMVFYAWRKLRHGFNGRMDPFKFLGFNPLDPEFPLSDLQELQEVCRGESIQRDYFRRQMTSEDSFLKLVGKVDANSDKKRAGKPANLYTPEDD